MRETLSLMWFLVQLRVRTRLEYRAGLVVAWLAQAFGYTGVFASIWVIVARFEHIGGWTWPEVALLLGFHVLSYAIGASLTFVQLRNMEDQVRQGTFDVLLVRPINPWAYLCFSGINIEYGGHVALGLVLLAWSLPQLAIDWSWLTVLQLLLSFLSSAILTGAIITMVAATALILGRSRYLFGIYFSFWELARYPLPIFGAPLQALLLTVVPLGFMAYVPVAALLGKPVPFLGDYAGLGAILAGPLAALAAIWFWRFCLQRYQGAGG
ncbi:MAG TPA: ABC-2 family transporter protein [Devosia sp.]|uniref:ABC transporter permease n=1 Tax=Devosia sp. TaxID=1871048 RepID=UPI002F93F5E5